MRIFVTSVLDLPEDANPILSELARYWTSIKPENGLPSRQQIDPSAIVRMLDRVWLLDVVDTETPDYRFRLVGTCICRHLGIDPTGRPLSDHLGPDHADQVYNDLSRIAREHVARYKRGQPSLQFANHYESLEQISLPLASDGLRVDTILSATVFYPEIERIGLG